MTESRTCSRCGATLPADAPGGHCLPCLLQLGLTPEAQADLLGVPPSGGPAGEPAEAGTPNATLQTTALPLAEKPGDRIGHYKLLQQIGEGGCGVVYMAEQEQPVRRRVALKIIKLGMDTRNVIARFEAERQALAMMDHPNIAKVFDAGAIDSPHNLAQASPPASSPGVSPGIGPGGGTPPKPAGGDACATLPSGRPYFVMELVRGVKITTYCDQQKLSTRQRLDLFIQVCQTVQHAHQKGIIHRDLKPSNILVTEQDGAPVPKIIDFGIAKATTDQRLTDKTLFTAFEQFIGTPAYMSPEQAGLGGLDIDTRSDIYSLGVLLYELLTGQAPFDADQFARSGLHEIMRVIREKEPPRPSARLTTLTEQELTTVAQRRQIESTKLPHLLRGDLDWIVMKALDKDRRRRYETANGFARDLQRFLDNEAVIARPPSNFYRFHKMVRRNKVAFAAGAGIAAALVLGLAIALWQSIEKTRAYNRAVAAEHAAQTEAQILKDMLAGAGPEVAKGRDATILLEMLDKTAERISKELTSQPAVESDLSVTVGRLYRSLGQPQKAEPFLRRALAVRNKGDPNRDRSDILGSLGDVLFDEGKLAEAEDLKRRALAMHRKFGGDDAETAALLSGLADHLTKQGKLSEAKLQAAEALAIIQKLFGEDDLRAALALHALGLAEDGQQNYQDAEAHLRQAAAILEKERGTQDRDLQIVRNNLASVLRAQKKWREAEIQQREALVVLKKLLGDDHPHVAALLNNLAFVFAEQGKLLDAENTLSESLNILRKRLGNENPQLGSALNNLGGTLYRESKLTEAVLLLREAVELYRKNPDWPLNEQTTAFDSLGKALAEQENLVDAEAIQVENLALLRKKAPDGGHILGALAELTVTLNAQKKFTEAEPVARECLELRQKQHPEYSTTFSAQVLLGESLLGRKKYANAEPLLLSGYGGMEQRKESGLHTDYRFRRQPRLKKALELLVQLYEETSRPDQAAEWKQKLAEFEKTEAEPKPNGR